jgi:hypothetical protein
LDRAVFEAYGWSDLGDVLIGQPGATTPLAEKAPEQSAAEDELLNRLVALNLQRAAEETQGVVRWLRPEYQAPGAEHQSAELLKPGAGPVLEIPAAGKQPWPKSMSEQVAAIRSQLSLGPRTCEALAENFKRKPVKSIEQVLAALQVLGHVKQDGERWQLI